MSVPKPIEKMNQIP